MQVADLQPEHAGRLARVTFADGDVRTGTLRRAIRRGTPPGRTHHRNGRVYQNAGWPPETFWGLAVPSRLPFAETDLLDLSPNPLADVELLPEAA